MPTRRTINRSGYETAPGQPGCHVHTDLPAPLTGRHGAANSIDTGASRKCRCARSCQPAGRSIDPATKQRPVNRAGNRAHHALARFNGRRCVAGELHSPALSHEDACSCQPAGRSIDPATKQRPVNRADNRARHASARFNERRCVAGELHSPAVSHPARGAHPPSRRRTAPPRRPALAGGVTAPNEFSACHSKAC